MNDEEYLRRRIDDLEKAVLDSALPLNVRKNQAVALLSYRRDLEAVLEKKHKLK